MQRRRRRAPEPQAFVPVAAARRRQRVGTMPKTQREREHAGEQQRRRARCRARRSRAAVPVLEGAHRAVQRRRPGGQIRAVGRGRAEGHRRQRRQRDRQRRHRAGALIAAGQPRSRFWRRTTVATTPQSMKPMRTANGFVPSQLKRENRIRDAGRMIAVAEREMPAPFPVVALVTDERHAQRRDGAHRRDDRDDRPGDDRRARSQVATLRAGPRRSTRYSCGSDQTAVDASAPCR